MFNLVPLRWEVHFKSQRIEKEWVTPEPEQITNDQYQVLKQVLGEKFIEINKTIYNTSEILKISPVMPPRPQMPERWMYDSDEEYKEALENYNAWD